MRDFIIIRIMKGFKNGLDELSSGFWKYYSTNHPIYKRYVAWEKKYENGIERTYIACNKRGYKFDFRDKLFRNLRKSFAFELESILEDCGNETLLDCYTGQMCQRFR